MVLEHAVINVVPGREDDGAPEVDHYLLVGTP